MRGEVCLCVCIWTLLSTSVFTLPSFPVKAHKDCTEGMVWKEDCADCKCTEQGPRCAALPNCALQPVTSPKTRCHHEERWTEDCNSCWCEKGTAVCTRMACPPQHVHRRNANSSSSIKCTPGQVWIQMTDEEGCAEFTCLADGTVKSEPHFTREMCPSQPYYIEKTNHQKPSDGHHLSKRKAECTPGRVWIQMTDNDEGCAKFTCLADGTVKSEPHFTREMCPSNPQYIEEPNHQKSSDGHRLSKRQADCTPGRVWIQMTDNEGCAKFTCLADGTVKSEPHFTREMCPSKPQYIEEPNNQDHSDGHQLSKREAGCRPGEKWMEDCNECTCNNEGKGSCTRKLCEGDAPDQIPWLL